MVRKLLTLTDPISNTTTWTYDRLNRVTKERNTLNKDRLWEYDAASNVTEYTDRNGRVTEYDYDNLHRRTSETWLDGMSVVNTLEYEYDAASQLLTASDDYSDYEYSYDLLGRVTEVIAAHSGLLVKFNQAYDANGRRIELAASIHDGMDYVDDFVNEYTYDNLNRMTQVTQAGVYGGNAVAEKRVDFSYNAAGQFTGIDRFADLAGTALVAATSYAYDGIGRLTSLTHEKDTTVFADYQWTYDAFSRVTQFTFDSLIGGSGQSDYTYDETGQLTAADHDYQSDEEYEYDENGNPIGTGFTIGTNNRLLSDGTYNYEYDDEGNRTKRTEISSGEYIVYGWDHRNRLTSVEFFDDEDELQKRVEYDYDVWNRLIEKRVDDDGDEDIDRTEQYVYDEGTKRDPATGHLLNEIALLYDDSSLTNRYLHGPGIDQVLADENLDLDAVFWLLGDNQNSIRDVATYDDTLDETTIVNHIDYSGFGEITNQTDDDYQPRHTYTSQEWDADALMYFYDGRWYDPFAKRFISEDPSGFAAGDTNKNRLVWNSPTNFIDPTGREGVTYGYANGTVSVAYNNWYIGWVPDPMANVPMVQRHGHQVPLNTVLAATSKGENWDTWFPAAAAKHQADEAERIRLQNRDINAHNQRRSGHFAETVPGAAAEQFANEACYRRDLKEAVAIGGALVEEYIPQTPIELIMAMPGVGGLVGQVFAKGGKIIVKYGGKLIAHTADEVAEYLAKKGIRTLSNKPDDLARAFQQQFRKPGYLNHTGAQFGNNAKLQDHFKRHGSDFGATTAPQYQRQADGFLTDPLPSGVLEKTRANGDVVRFNPTTDEFGVVSSTGTLRTYYKPCPTIHGHPTNLDYFNAQ